MEKLKEILSHFAMEGEVTAVLPLGNGLINDTYKAVTAGNAPDYVLQRINDAVFTQVDLLQHNIDCVTGHIRRKLLAQNEEDIDRKVLRFLPEKTTGKTYYFDGEKYWRVSVFIPDTETFEAVTPEYSYCAGKAFGHFEAMLIDLPDPLGETIPDFHNMELRLRQLVDAVQQNRGGRLGKGNAELEALLEEIDRNGEEMCKAERLYREGLLPKRICHCDTKVNNMLFDKEGNVLCVIDLDTVMPSFVFSDFGDFLRTAANTAAEDAENPEEVRFNMDIFKAFSRGYLESAACFLTPIERENLPYAACLFPFMQAVRFFTDYLNGDTYYKIKYPEHNLVRTRAQMQLFRSATACLGEMKACLAGM